MTQTVKSLVFVAVAVVSVAVAAGTYFSNRPVDINEFVDVGSKFYPNYDDPNVATGLQVAAYQDETGKTELFKVDVKDGVWKIPSHHNYPADGQDRLAKTAASMVGVIRSALVERSKAAQKRYNVVDPLDKDASTEGRGDRITLYKGDEVLVDFIVGKKVENAQDLYYVRRADEDRIYTADLGRFEVSTKFSDWIKKDILEVERDDVQEILIGRYHVDEQQGKVVQEGKIELIHDAADGTWKITGLKADKEKVKTSEISNLLTTLDDLKIVGVRPKPPGLSKGLSGDEASIAIDPLVQRDMMEKGVFISGRGDFVYNEGKVNVGMNNGVMYELGFGEEFSGSDVDIEIGKQTPPAVEAEKLAKEVEEKPEAEKKADAPKPGEKKSRYLFVTAAFDKSLAGPEPKAPVKPEAPAETPAPEKKDEPAAEKPEEKAGEEQTKLKPADPKIAYEKALEEYKLQSEVFELQKKDYDAKLKAGEARVAELNRRFADWYYVISEEDFAKLKLKREDLVEKVEPPAEPAAEKPMTDAPAPEKMAPEKPAADKPAGEKMPAGEAPAADKPATPEKSEADTPETEKPKIEEEPKPTPPTEGTDKPEPATPAEPAPAN